ncbi:MAG TPA: MoaD/ThiS family protein [Thermoanaerobaculia bacterium]|nr:MoaD/ThiS family protein [Thermoanaerobaculia bacterium]
MSVVKVRLLLFAVLRDIIGASEVELELEHGARAVDVWSLLRAKHPALSGYVLPPLTAINERYVPAETLLESGDDLAFIPPVAGG